MNIEVDGHQLEIDEKRLKSLKAFRLIERSETSDNNMERLGAMIDMVEYIAGISEDDLLEMCGGELTPIDEVMEFVTKVIGNCYPKN